MSFLEHLNESLSKYGRLVVATMVDFRGSVPQVSGSKIIVVEDKLVWGTVGGGKLENYIIKRASTLLFEKKRKTDFLTINLQRDLKMTCGGEASFFLEVYGEEEFEIAVFGAGHVAQTLVPMLLKLRCKVHCIDSRKEWVDKLEDHPRLRKICLDEPSQYVKDLRPESFILSMTQGHKFDLPILIEAFKRSDDFPYIGVIGSHQKRKAIISELLENRLEEDIISRLFCPMGLEFGRNIPEEIAFSIVAEVLTERDKFFK